MCIIWETKFLCGCIIDEWWFACTNLRHDISNTGLRFLARSHVNCKAREIQRWRECLLLCELCLGKLHARVRKDADIRKTLASKETFPLAEQLGMLIVLENDALVQRGIFGKGKWRRMNMEIDKLEGLVTDVEKRVGYR
ncbi:hypothetical protein BDW74DRAFT_144717 [Aspergillus multicolor]|uniref:uncharacterized protein n=1 Tax=Aspergillus multicolor TaxID=41759 RepID=UPI003CCE388D